MKKLRLRTLLLGAMAFSFLQGEASFALNTTRYLRDDIQSISSKIAAKKKQIDTKEAENDSITDGLLDTDPAFVGACRGVCDPTPGKACEAGVNALNITQADGNASGYCVAIFKADPSLSQVSPSCASLVKNCGTNAKELKIKQNKRDIDRYTRELSALEAEKSSKVAQLADLEEKLTCGPNSSSYSSGGFSFSSGNFCGGNSCLPSHFMQNQCGPGMNQGCFPQQNQCLGGFQGQGCFPQHPQMAFHQNMSCGFAHNLPCQQPYIPGAHFNAGIHLGSNNGINPFLNMNPYMHANGNFNLFGLATMGPAAQLNLGMHSPFFNAGLHFNTGFPGYNNFMPGYNNFMPGYNNFMPGYNNQMATNQMLATQNLGFDLVRLQQIQAGQGLPSYGANPFTPGGYPMNGGLPFGTF